MALVNFRILSEISFYYINWILRRDEDVSETSDSFTVDSSIPVEKNTLSSLNVINNVIPVILSSTFSSINLRNLNNYGECYSRYSVAESKY